MRVIAPRHIALGPPSSLRSRPIRARDPHNPGTPRAAMGAGVTVRPVATPDDLRHFKAMTLRYLEWLAEDLCYQGVDEELAGLPGAYAPSAGGCMLLAEDAAGACVGAVAVRALAGKHAGELGEDVAGVAVGGVCEMKRLFVEPESQGRGAGGALVEAALREAAALGYQAMALDTLQRLAAANRLYRAQGFQPCAPYNVCPLPGVLYFCKHLQ